MAFTGRVANIDIIPGTVVPVYAVPRGPLTSDNMAMVSVNVVNRGSQAAAVSIALCEDGVYTPTGANWIEYNTEIIGHGVLERTSILLGEGQSIQVTGSDSNLGVVVMAVFTGTLSEDNLLINGELTDSADDWTLSNATWNSNGTVTVYDGNTGTGAGILQTIADPLAAGTYAWEIAVRNVAGFGNINFSFVPSGGGDAQGYTEFDRDGLYRGEFTLAQGGLDTDKQYYAQVFGLGTGTADVDYVRLYKIA